MLRIAEPGHPCLGVANIFVVYSNFELEVDNKHTESMVSVEIPMLHSLRQLLLLFVSNGVGRNPQPGGSTGQGNYKKAISPNDVDADEPDSNSCCYGDS